jgi:long-subunit fatty acid transport protein
MRCAFCSSRLFASLSLPLLVLIALSTRRTARAAGLEDTMTGTINLGRAANALRVQDFMATWQNPANLALIPSNDLGGELRLPLLHSCFDRARDNSAMYRINDPAQGLAGTESFQNVCNDGAHVPSGNLGFAQAFDSGWGWGIGFFTPAINAASKYGNRTIVTQFPLANETLPLTTSGNESPNRFLLLERTVLGGFLQAGAGVQLSRKFRVGASVGLGFANIHNVNVASVQGGTFRDQEVLTDLKATDWLIPRAAVSVVVAPVDSFEAMASLTYQSDVHAKGDVEFTTNGIQGGPLTDCRAASPARPGPHCKSGDAEVTVPFPPLEAVLGMRYAKRRNPRVRALDSMRDEVWDVEVNGYWSQTSHVDADRVKLYDQAPGAPGSTNLTFSSAPNATTLSVPGTITVPHRWRDTFGVRAGGDYNLVPGKFSVRLGVSYETRAVPIEYMNIDAWPVAKLGLHAGGTVAFDKLKLSIAYAHIFYQSVDVGVGAGRVPEIVSQQPNAAQPVNEGYYQAALDVVSVQANVAF